MVTFKDADDDDDDEESVGAMLRQMTTHAGSPPSTPTRKQTNVASRSSIETSPSGDTDLESYPPTPHSSGVSHPLQQSPSSHLQPHRLTIDHKHHHHDDKRQHGRRGFFMGTASTWCRCCRPVVLVLALILFVALGGVGFLLDQFVRILPGYKRQIEQLEAHVQELETQVTRLEGAVDDLHAENARYTTLNEELNGTVIELSAINNQFQQLNEQLNQSNIELERLTGILGNQTAEYASHNEDLRSLVGFLNSTGTELGQSVELLTSYLDDRVQFYQSSSLRTLELDYRVLMRSWDCDFREFFMGHDFTVNAAVAVGATRYPAVRNYVQERILDDLCLDATDWEVFMERVIVQGQVEDVTTTQLVRGVQNYTTQALQFYFPMMIM